MKLNDKAYKILKWIALIVLPAIAVLYSRLSNIWGLPYGPQISETIAAIETFIGILIGISTYRYNKDMLEDD